MSLIKLKCSIVLCIVPLYKWMWLTTMPLSLKQFSITGYDFKSIEYTFKIEAIKPMHPSAKYLRMSLSILGIPTCRFLKKKSLLLSLLHTWKMNQRSTVTIHGNSVKRHFNCHLNDEKKMCRCATLHTVLIAKITRSS